MPHRENKFIVRGTELRTLLQEGAHETYETVGATFGPMSGNVIIQKNWGLARLTHDGITVAREIFLSDSVKNAGATLLASASKKTLETVGDGTSATVILGYTILALANKAATSGRNPMLMKRGIIRAAIDAKREIDNLKQEIVVPENATDPNQLEQIATISASGDKAIGSLVAETVNRVGKGITIEEYNGLNIEKQIVEGYYFESGYVAPQLSTMIETDKDGQAYVVVVSNTLSRVEDVFPFIKKMFDENKRKLLIVGRVNAHAIETLTAQVMNGAFEVTVADAPIAGQQRIEFLNDVAAITGARLLPNLTNAKFSDLGKIDKATLTSRSTTIFGGAGDPEQVLVRMEAIKQQLKDETIEVLRMHLENRLAKLNGKVGLIQVGGATPTEVKEKKDRVDDAVKAAQAAIQEGIIAGGGTALVEVSRRLEMEKSELFINRDAIDDLTDIQDKGYISVEGNVRDAVTRVYDNRPSTSMLPDELEGYRIVIEALKEPFRVLMENSGQMPDYNLKMVQKAGYGFGYHAERPTEDPINLFDAGVVDPALVLKMVVENGCSIAGDLITAKAGIFHEDLEKVEDIEMED